MAIAEELQIIVDAKVASAIRDMKKVDQSISGTTKTTSKLKDAFKAMAGPVAIGAVVAGFVSIAKESSKLAAAAEEIRSKFNVVFGETAEIVEDWAETYSESVGRSETDTLSFLGTIGDTLKPLGFAKEAVDAMSQQVVELAGDLGSFNDIPTEEVIRGIQSALVGNVETLRRYGVVANEASIKQEALNSGLWDGTGVLDAQVKAQAILNITMKGTVDAQGDLARTQESTTNTMIRLGSATKDLKIQLGQTVNEGLTPLASATADIIKDFTDWIDRTSAVKAALKELKKEGSNTSDNQIVLLQEEVRLEKLKLEQVQSSRNALINLNAEQTKAADATVQRQVDVIKGIQDIIDAYEIQDSWITKLEGDTSAAARAEADAAAKVILLFEKQTEAQDLLAQRKFDALSADEKQVALLDEQIDYWVQFRDVIGVQQLLNDLVKERNELLTEEGDILNENTKAAFTNASYVAAQLALQTYAHRVFTDDVKADNEEIKLSNQEVWSLATASATSFFSAIDALSSSFADAELSRMEAQGASQEQLDAKKKKIARDEAIRKKALGLLNVGIDTASAIIGFLAMQPVTLANVGLSVAAGITGGIQAAAIAATPMPAFATGGDFITSGAQTILVGDNPGGKERVSITPLSSQNINGPSGGGGITIVMQGDVYGAGGTEEFINGIIEGISKQQRTRG